jgi:hypothetical protein
MSIFPDFVIAVIAAAHPSLFAQESKPNEPRNQLTAGESKRDSWTRALADRAKRGTLHDEYQYVRGDIGRWSDEPRLQHAPPIERKPPKMPLDDWFDRLLEQKNVSTTSRGDDNWLLFRGRQLDDNDRVWVERLERKGNQFTVVVHEAVWQGRYFKTFTSYDVFGVNLGKLEPGKYEARWIIKPFVFKQFEGPGQQRDNWCKDERPAGKKDVELRVEFSVLGEPQKKE